jgi:signal transduction histidine kinase
MIKLYIVDGPMEGHSFNLKKGITFIGRASDNDIQIKDKSISRKHVKIILKGDKFFVEDLNSQNGTYINGNEIKSGEEFEVDEGIPVAIGNTLISLGKKYSEDDMVYQYTINLSEKMGENGENLLYKDRRITDRNQLELIYGVSTILMQSLDINEICEKIMSSLFSCLKRIDSGAILLIDNKTGELKEIIARSRDTGKSIKMNYSRTIVNRVIREGQAAMMSDTTREDESDLSESIEMMLIRSIMCVPLISKSEIRGVIYVHSVNVPHGFRKDDAEEELNKSHERLRNLSKYLQSSIEQERTSIAREIHDDLGQILSVLKMDLSWFGKRLPKSQTLVDKKKSMEKVLNEAIKTVKRIITDLRPSLLDDLGLIAAIEWQAEEFQTRSGLECKLTVEPEDFVVDQERSTALFRIFQETLTNIIRHANATNVNISLTKKTSNLVMKVSDDGKGITKEQISHHKSFGLMGIRERAHGFGGNVEIVGIPGRGTTLTVKIPFDEAP